MMRSAVMHGIAKHAFLMNGERIESRVSQSLVADAGPGTVAVAVTVGDMTIESTVPGELRRLGEALIGADAALAACTAVAS